MDAVTLALSKAYTNSQRLAYTAIEKAPVATTDVGAVSPHPAGFCMKYVQVTDYSPAIGDVLHITWDGTEYTQTLLGEPGTDQDGNEIVVPYAGNLSVLDESLTDTGEPFLVRFAPEEDGNVMGVFCFHGTEDHTISISRATEVVHPIDPKFLPGVCLPVVELSTLLYVGLDMELTEEESAQLQAAFDTGLPAVIKFRVCDGGTGDNPDYHWVSMMFHHNMQMVNDYSCGFYTWVYIFAPGNDSSKWMYLIQDLSGGN